MNADLKQEQAKERLHAAIRGRELEIQLFWQRALFFWGFTAAAFVALTSVYGTHPRLAIAISCFGLVCSVVWTLANRGSKYWHEAWETKVERDEQAVFGEELFGRIEDRQEKGWWLSARRYSVSKLAIALSDYVLVLWLGITAYQLVTLIPWCADSMSRRDVAALLLIVGTLAFIICILGGTPSDKVKHAAITTKPGEPRE